MRFRVSPVIFSPKCVELSATVDDGSKCAASSTSAFTILRWMDRVRRIVVKNRKPKWELQLRLWRFVFRLLGGPMICSCWLRVFWLFTLCILLYFPSIGVVWVCVRPYFFCTCHKSLFSSSSFFTTLRFSFSSFLICFWNVKTESSLSVFIMLFCSSEWTEDASRNFS